MERIALIGDNSSEYIEKLLDIWNCGNCAVLIDWRIPHKQALKMMEEANVHKCFIEKTIMLGIEEFSPKIEYESFEASQYSVKILDDIVCNAFKENYSLTEAVILYSSGTTGQSKGIILSHFAINTNADMILGYMNLTQSDIIYIVKTLAHSSTLVGELIVGLKSKIKIVISPTISNPRINLSNLNKYCVTTLCVNPTLLKLYSDMAQQFNVYTRHLKSIYTSGSIADISLITKAKEIFSSAEIYNVYGLSEAGPRVSAQKKSNAVNAVGSVGTPLKNVEIVIVSKEGKKLGACENGIIHIKTPSLFLNYVSTVKPRESLYKSWFNTGDIGYFDENGNLFIVGRVDNMLTVGSHNIYPEDIENTINSSTDAKNCIIIAQANDLSGSKLYCCYEAEYNMEKELRKFCIENFATYEIPARFIRVQKIHINNNGKKIRDIKLYNEVFSQG